MNQPTENTVHYSLCDGETLRSTVKVSAKAVLTPKLVNWATDGQYFDLIIRTGTQFDKPSILFALQWRKF
ncbi:MAG: hypothetical protein IPG18_00660 [Saprospiraceae bacterium]|nr:hypothetical protein [Saprospiraceae bacterium]